MTLFVIVHESHNEHCVQARNRRLGERYYSCLQWNNTTNMIHTSILAIPIAGEYHGPPTKYAAIHLSNIYNVKRMEMDN